ncbi:hypothetical protein [Sulfurovum sp.]|uniref:hypothetical protein n=1 Tax=Sulfurovum sp. TaxID=1969726 RepID=UPI0025FDCC3E|nr:hypothetical protein [Sulfurovum sp.]
MKKVLILLILFYGHLYALDRDSTLKLYHKLFFSLSPKAEISVYVNDNEYRKIFLSSKRLQLTKEPKDADIVLITDERTLEKVLAKRQDIQTDKKPILFVTDHHFLDRSKDIVGAFYWRKGRSQLLFVKNRLDQYHIVLPAEYQKFIIDEL